MKNLALKTIQNMDKYNPPLSGRRQSGALLLDFNERTVVPSQKIRKKLLNFFESGQVQIYPEYDNLEKQIANYAGVSNDSVMLTNGSDQAIDLIFRTFVDNSDQVIIPEPSFAMFSQCARMVGAKIINPLYKKDTLRFPLKEVMQSINSKTKLIVICNPNNPTGTLLSVPDIEKIANKAKNSIVLIDEAYFEFSKISAVKLFDKYSNIIITRTFSKAFGLASLRIGFILASKIYIDELLKVRGPYDVNYPSVVAAGAAIENWRNIESYCDEVVYKAKPMVENFFSKNKISFYESSANFILFRPDDSKFTEETLRANGILVRVQNKKNIENTLRVTIGTVGQMKKFISVYQEKILNKKKIAFIDRDGTLILEPQDTFQVDSIRQLEILPGVIEGLKILQSKGYKLIMVTNQDGLGSKSYPKENFENVQNKLLEIFKTQGILFKEILVCPHLPQDNCFCRKPKTGLVEKFIKQGNIDGSKSFVYGDRGTDKQFAKNLGIKFIPMKTNGNFFEGIASVIPAKAGIYSDRSPIRSGMTRKKNSSPTVQNEKKDKLI